MVFLESAAKRYPAGTAIHISAEENTHGLHVLTDSDIRYLVTGGQ